MGAGKEQNIERPLLISGLHLCFLLSLVSEPPTYRYHLRQRLENYDPCLFLYSPQTKNGFYIFKGLQTKPKKNMKPRPYVACKVYDVCYFGPSKYQILFSLYIGLLPQKTTPKQVYLFISSLFHPTNITEHVYNRYFLKYWGNKHKYVCNPSHHSRSAQFSGEERQRVIQLLLLVIFF